MPWKRATANSGTITKTVSLKGILGLRGTTTANSAASGNATSNSTHRIYEIQATRDNYKRVSFHLARKILSKMKDYNSSLETATLTMGTWTSPSMQLNPSTFKALWWNESLVGTDGILIYFRTGATKTICEAAAWVPSGGYSQPNAQSLTTAAVGIWVQYKIEFTCTDTTVSNPKVYSANGFLVKITYSKGATQMETAVELIYDIGFRNFDFPSLDKIFQKINLVFEGTEGSFQVYWETENATGNFTISLGSFPARWDSFFPSTAMGKELKIKIYKNDLYPFKLKEIQGFYSPCPLII